MELNTDNWKPGTMSEITAYLQSQLSHEDVTVEVGNTLKDLVDPKTTIQIPVIVRFVHNDNLKTREYKIV